MGCAPSKDEGGGGGLDHRYDEHGNLVITKSSASNNSRNSNNNHRNLKQNNSGGGDGGPGQLYSSFSSPLDVTTLSTEQLLKGSKQVQLNKPERLYLLLEKALYQQQQQSVLNNNNSNLPRTRTPGGSLRIDIDALDDLIQERQTLYVAVIDQIQRAEATSRVRKNDLLTLTPAKYCHPLTQQTPLHLACRLVDVDQNQISAKELCRVMDALLRTYPQALTHKDAKGYVPIHYAIGPNHYHDSNTNSTTQHNTQHNQQHCYDVNAKRTTTTNGTIVTVGSSEEKKSDDTTTTTTTHSNNNNKHPTTGTTISTNANAMSVDRDDEDWRARGIFVQHLFHSNLKAAHEYWQQSDVIYDDEKEMENDQKRHPNEQQQHQPPPNVLTTGGCSPLYRVLQTIPDDFDRSGPTVDYIKVLAQASYCYDDDDDAEDKENDDEEAARKIRNDNNNNNMAGIGNASDGDKPLGLLYRRFTRQFDISEMFFPGDNSRPEVVRHREKYKYAAGNTWKIIEALLTPPAHYQQAQQDQLNSPLSQQSSTSLTSTHNKATSTATPAKSSKRVDNNWGIVHRAVQMETPPDLLRYIVETNAQDLTKVDADGNLPLHYAAMVKPPQATTTTTTLNNKNNTNNTHFPSFYSKYVVDELLYKFAEAAGMTNTQGKFPLTLAVTSGKQWIGGGIKSLYDAYPKALHQIDLEQRHHHSLRQVLSMDDDDEDEGNDNPTYDDEGNRVVIVEGEKNGEKNTAPISPTSKEILLQHVTSNNSKKVGMGMSTSPMNSKDNNEDDDDDDGIIKDEHHDAIMLVQQPNVDCREVAIAMWAHEEDAGVQMLGCCAIVRLLQRGVVVGSTVGTTSNDHNSNNNSNNNGSENKNDNDNDNDRQNNNDVNDHAHDPPYVPVVVTHTTLRMALTATASVVNAMKAHPNEMIVQEKACAALQLLAPADGRREVSMVASGAVASVVAAMQAHVGDQNVQEEACAAIGAIVHHGGGDRATVVASVSGVTAILNALAAHPRCVEVQLQGLNALWQLTNFSSVDASMPELPRTQTEPLLAQAQDSFPTECTPLVTKLIARMKE